MPGRRTFAEMHAWVEARLSDYIDNQLPPGERTPLEAHLGECAQCRTRLESLRWTVSLLKLAPTPAPARSFTLPLEPARDKRIGASQRASSTWTLPLARWGAALATLLFVALIGIDMITQTGGAKAPTVLKAPAAAQDAAATQAVALAPKPTATPTSMPTGLASGPTSAQKPTGVPALGEQSVAPTAQRPTLAPAPAAQATALPPAYAPPAAPTKALERSSRPPEGSATITALDAQKVLGGTTTAKQPAGSAITTTATSPAATATPPPSPTATLIPPTVTLAPTVVAQARVEPTAAPPSRAVPTSTTLPPLRVAEIGALFLAIFFGMLAVLLWRRK